MTLGALATDPALPGLRVASDRKQMREVFQRHLRPLLSIGCDIQDCRLSRIRYRRAERCVVQYTLHLADTSGGKEWIQWVTGTMYTEGRGRRKWDKLRACGGVELPNGFSAFQPFFFIPDLGMLVQVFPYDRRLPNLPLLMAGPLPEIEALLLARFGPGGWHTESWSIEPIRYRAGSGATLRLTVQAQEKGTGRRQKKCFYAKVYRDTAEGEHSHQVHRALRNRPNKRGAGFSVASPIAYLGDLRMLLQEESPGTSLQDVLLRDDDVTLALRKTAGALAAMHLDHWSTGRRYHRMQNEIAELRSTGRRLSCVCPHLEREVQAIVGEVVDGLEEVLSAPTHRDLKLDHILLDGECVGFIDFDTFAHADPVLDTATVMAHLVGLHFRFPLWLNDRGRNAAQIFAEEYFSRVPRAWRGRLAVHYAGAALKMALGFFRRQEPEWPDTITALVDEAKRSLAGEAW